MWYRGLNPLKLQKVEKALRKFLSNANPVTRPKLSFPGGSDKIGPYGFFMLTIPVVTFGLGTWQIQRLQWKTDLIQSLLEKTKSEPQELPEDPSELAALEYRPVRVRGSYDHSREVFIGPRSQIINTGDEELGRSGLLSTGSSGLNVVTPFKLADSDLESEPPFVRSAEILVNRGWVPKGKASPSNRAAGQIEGEHEIVGVVRLNEKRSQFQPANSFSEKNKMYLYRDIPAMSSHLGTRPVFLDLAADSTIPGAPMAGQTRVTLRNEHLSYVFTWYLLSAFTSVMWFRRFVALPRIRAKALRGGF